MVPALTFNVSLLPIDSEPLEVQEVLEALQDVLLTTVIPNAARLPARAVQVRAMDLPGPRRLQSSS